MGFVENTLGRLFGDIGFEEPDDLFVDQAAVADLLPYRLFDPETGFYYNDKSTGFIVEVDPKVATDEAVGNLHSAMMSSMPTLAGIQILNWTSPNVTKQLGAWAQTRLTGGEVVEAMSSKRIDHLDALRFGTEATIKAIPANRRVFVTGWIEGDTSMSALTGLREYRRSVLGALGLDKDATLKPVELLRLLEELMHAEQWGQFGQSEYTTDLPLNAQIPGTTLKVGRDHLELGGSPKVSLTAASVARYPREWDDALGFMLFGDPDKISDRPHGPVLSCLTAFSIPGQQASSDIIKRRAKLEHSEKTGFSKFVNDFAGKRNEYQSLASELEMDERLFQTVMSVFAYTQGGRDEARAAGSEMSKIYRRVGISLRHEKYLQLPMFVTALPLGCTSQHIKTYGNLQRMRLLKAKAFAALSPLQGEWKGNSNGQGMLLVGRQGQVFNWSSFISEGNYNVAVVGKSGAGKSVFMQEMITSIYANGGRALVIDDGYSFKTTCEILGGRHIAFDGSQKLGLNPFSMLQADKMDSPEYASEAIELITRVVASMAALGEQREGRVTGIEEEAISSAVQEVWKSRARAGEITDVYEILLEGISRDTRLTDVCRKLEAFTRDGIYGDYFTGPATVDVDTPFTVVELSDVKSQPALEEVILQMVMFLGTELMYKTDRSVPVAIVIDEAWDMLKGGGTASFIEGVVRRARKYNGALITGTQSIDDYYANPASEVCLQNSDWTVFLAQKPETIDRLEANKMLSIPPGFGERLKTLTSVPGQFSEMAIKGQGGWFFARLMLDPFSLAVFSSKGTTVENLRRRQAAGMTTVDALHDMVEKGEVS